jgi:pilus assembly protein CpaB
MKQAIALSLSILLGLLAVFAMRSHIEREKASTKVKVDEVEVLFASQPVLSGAPLTKNMVQIRTLPSSAVSSDMVKPHELIEIMDKAIQREVNRGGPIFHSDFLKAKMEALTGILPGRRLVSVPVSQVTGISGLIKPGDRVDILYSHQVVGRNDTKATTEMLIENITVHATDNKTVDTGLVAKQRQKLYSTLTLLATPTEAAVLTNASREGTLTFLLRSPKDLRPGTFSGKVNATNLTELAKTANRDRWKGGSSKGNQR